jgi:hypothetical protein
VLPAATLEMVCMLHVNGILGGNKMQMERAHVPSIIDKMAVILSLDVCDPSCSSS